MPEKHIQNEGTTSREPITSQTTANNGIDPGSVGNSIELQPTSQSRQENAQSSHRVVKVPRSERRGLFARAGFLAEVKDPCRYPYRTKWFITFLVAYAAAAGPLGSAIFFRL